MSRSCQVGADTFTVTLSKVAVASVVLVWLLTTTPTRTVAGMPIDAVPTFVHVAPSDERYAVRDAPARTIRSHAGAVPAPPLMLADAPPVVVRYWSASPLPGDTIIAACCEPASGAERITPPAFAHGPVSAPAAPRATISPPPLRRR